MELKINQQYAKIGMDIKEPVLKLEISEPQLQTTTSRAELSIEAGQAVLHIDQSQCFADAGLRNLTQFAAYCGSLAYNDYSKGLDRVVGEGHMLARIEDGASISQVAFNRCNPAPDPITVVAIPKQPPRTWFDSTPVKYDYSPAQVQSELRRGNVENNCERGYVDIYLLQKNSIEINWVNNNYDIYA